MKVLPILLVLLVFVIPVVSSAIDEVATPTEKIVGQKEESTSEPNKISEAEGIAGRDVFDLFDAFLPHAPWAFIDKSWGLERELFRRTSPRYDIKYNPENVVMTVEVPDFAPDDITVEVKSGGRILSVSAKKEALDEDHAFSSEFSQSFTLDPGVETDKLTANLSDGILTLKAPRHATLPPNRKISITHLDQNMLEEMANEEEK